MSIESVMPSSHLFLCHPLLLPPIPPSIRVFSNESTLCMRWPKYWSFSFSINPSKEHPGLISFRMDWLDLLAVQGTLKSLLQHHSSKVSILWRSAFFTVQLSHPYMTTGKTIALTRRTFVGKVMSQGGLKLKKVGKITRPFRYDLNQIPYSTYTVEVTNRFKGLDLVHTVPEELWMEVCDIVQETGIKTIPKKNKCKNLV